MRADLSSEKSGKSAADRAIFCFLSWIFHKNNAQMFTLVAD